MPALPSFRLANQIASLPPTADATGPLWHGPAASGPFGGVTQSMLGRYLSCRERFRVKYVLGLEPTDQWSKSIGYGNMWHVCEEALAEHNADWQVQSSYVEHALQEHTRSLLHKYPMQRQEIEKWYNVCMVQFPEYAKHWSQHPDVIDRQPLMQEQVFDVPYTLPSGRTVRLRGKFDSVDLIPSQGGIFLQENKTKGDIDTTAIQRQLRFDLQTLTYLIALKYDGQTTFSHPVCGVRYNIVRRPLSGGKGSIKPHEQKVKKARYGTGRNAGKLLDPGSITPAETDEQFYERLRRDYIAAEPEYWFVRFTSVVTAADIVTFRQTCLDPLLENLCDDYEWWRHSLERSEPQYHWLYRRRAVEFPEHKQRHYRHPFGVYSPLDESGSTEYDAYLDSGSEGGLRRATTLFPELQEAA